jgi:hypothetical protein
VPDGGGGRLQTFAKWRLADQALAG